MGSRDAGLRGPLTLCDTCIPRTLKTISEEPSPFSLGRYQRADYLPIGVSCTADIINHLGEVIGFIEVGNGGCNNAIIKSAYRSTWDEWLSVAYPGLSHIAAEDRASNQLLYSKDSQEQPFPFWGETPEEDYDDGAPE
jgi:hypothetical protein